MVNGTALKLRGVQLHSLSLVLRGLWLKREDGVQ